MSVKCKSYDFRFSGDSCLPVYFLNAYAVSPDSGSEPGVGFSWFQHLLQHYRVILFTEAEFANKILKWIELSGSVSSKIYFIDLGAAARKQCWNQGDWRFYFSYWQYQLAVLRCAVNELQFGKPVWLHQLNMIGFREPGYFWLISLIYRIPFLWGPIGGYNFPSGKIYEAYAWSVAAKQTIKNLLSCLTLLSPSVIASYFVANKILLAIPPVGFVLKFLLKKCILFPETFVNPNKISQRKNIPDGLVDTKSDCCYTDKKFQFVILGKLVPRKLIDILIDAVSNLDPFIVNKFNFIVVGDGPSKLWLQNYAVSKGVQDVFNFMGYVPHGTALTILDQSDGLVHCSIDEGTSHAIIEALTLRKIIIAYDCAGHSVIAKDIGFQLLRYPIDRADAVNLMSRKLCAVATSEAGTPAEGIRYERLHNWTGSVRVDNLVNLILK